MFLPHWVTHTVKTVSFFMILSLSAIVKSNHCACSQLHKRSSLYYACLIQIYIYIKHANFSMCLYMYIKKIFFVYSCNCDIGIKTLWLRMRYTYLVLKFVNIYMFTNCLQYMHYFLNWDLQVILNRYWHDIDIWTTFNRYEFSITEKQEWWTEPNSRRAFNSRGSEWGWGWPFKLNGQCLMGGILHYGENGVACWTRPLQYLCLSDIFVCGLLSQIQNESNIFIFIFFW